MLRWILDLNFKAWHDMAYSIYALHGSIRSSWTFELFFGTWGGGRLDLHKLLQNYIHFLTFKEV